MTPNTSLLSGRAGREARRAPMMHPQELFTHHDFPRLSHERRCYLLKRFSIDSLATFCKRQADERV